MELLASACTLSRWDDERSRGDHRYDAVARFFLADSLRHAEHCLKAIRSNDDALLLDAARQTRRHP